MAGGKPVIVRSTLEEDYKPSIQSIADAITKKTRLLIFSSPCNPSGSVLTQGEMEALAEVVLKWPDLYVISDEIYEHIVFDGHHRSIGTFPGMMERTITVNGLSKAFALTGWRIGFIGAPLWIAQAASKIQGQFTSGANSIAQRVTKACMEADPSVLAGMRNDFLRRRDLVLKEIQKVPGWRCNKPQGAFYVLPDASSSLNGSTIRTSVDLCLYLLDTAGVSIVEGDSFGAKNTVRISYATSDDKIVAAIDRIAKAIKDLK
jgi:aspartate aminotransferase